MARLTKAQRFNEMANKWDKNPDLMRQKVLMRRLEQEAAAHKTAQGQEMMRQGGPSQPDPRHAGVAPQQAPGSIAGPTMHGFQVGARGYEPVPQQGTTVHRPATKAPERQPVGDYKTGYGQSSNVGDWGQRADALRATGMTTSSQSHAAHVLAPYGASAPYNPAAQLHRGTMQGPAGHLAFSLATGTGRHQTMLNPETRGLTSWREMSTPAGQQDPFSHGTGTHQSAAPAQYDPSVVKRLPSSEEVGKYVKPLKGTYTPDDPRELRGRPTRSSHIEQTMKHAKH